MEDDLAQVLKAVSDMTHSAGWGYLKQYFGVQIAALQDEINQVGNNEMRFSGGDIKKLEMRNLKDIIEFPDRFIALNLKPPVENPDPYQD